MIPREILQEELITQLTTSNKLIEEIIAYLDVQIKILEQQMAKLEYAEPKTSALSERADALEQVKKWILENYSK